LKGLKDLRVLFVGTAASGSASKGRLKALERLGLDGIWSIDLSEYLPVVSLLDKICLRTQIGPKIARFNREILNVARLNRINVLFSDKALSLSPAALHKLRGMDVFTIDYLIDNPFGPRNDPGFRLFKKALPAFDLHAVQRQSSVKDFKDHGGREVVTTLVGYDRDLHFPSPIPLTDKDRTRNVSFIGSPYDNRAEFFTSLCHQNVLLDISGPRSRWEKALAPEIMKAIFRQGELVGNAYREGIWKSKINLCFVTKSNMDEVAQRSYEITAAAAFMLAERTPRHLELFKEDEEAIFFSSFEECLAKIRQYLPDEAARNRVAAAGHARTTSSGYDHDSILRKILTKAIELMAQNKQLPCDSQAQRVTHTFSAP